MSFGWSAGDIAQAIGLIVKVVKALDSTDGAPAHYREAVAFLRNLQLTLEPLQTMTVIGRYPAYGDEICEQVKQIKAPIEKFLALAKNFEPSLGAHTKNGSHRNIGKKLKWRFVDSKTVDEFRKKVEGHILVLNNLLHRLILEIISTDRAKNKEELQKTIVEVLNPGLETLLKDNLSSLREGLDTDRQTRIQQHEVKLEAQAQANGDKTPSTEISTLQQISNKQYELLMSKLQHQDANLARAVEQITGHLEEQLEIAREERRAAHEGSTIRAETSSSYIGTAAGGARDPPPNRDGGPFIQGLATGLQYISLISLGYIVRELMPFGEKHKCVEKSSETPSSQRKEEEFQGTYSFGLSTHRPGEYVSSPGDCPSSPWDAPNVKPVSSSVQTPSVKDSCSNKQKKDKESSQSEPPTSFLFIVNEQPTNDDSDYPESIPPRYESGRWMPPIIPEGYLAQVPGSVYRWSNGIISIAPNYQWTYQPVGVPVYANGTIYGTLPDGCVSWPTYYRAATIFYCNHFHMFHTTPGDASTKELAQNEDHERWWPLSFSHRSNSSFLHHWGEDGYCAVRKATWIDELLPKAYRCPRAEDSTQDGLSGLLPLIIALVAFSCADRDELYRILIQDQAWRGHKWYPHKRPTGRIERRGMVVTVFTDPENPLGSTYESIGAIEDGPVPIFK